MFVCSDKFFAKILKNFSFVQKSNLLHKFIQSQKVSTLIPQLSHYVVRTCVLVRVGLTHFQTSNSLCSDRKSHLASQESSQKSEILHQTVLHSRRTVKSYIHSYLVNHQAKCPQGETWEGSPSGTSQLFLLRALAQSLEPEIHVYIFLIYFLFKVYGAVFLILCIVRCRLKGFLYWLCQNFS